MKMRRFRIQHNIMAMNAYRNYNNTSALSKNLEKLSSGYKINRAGDDAAGLAISEKMRAQITGLKAASKNVKDGVSLVKTAEGALQEVHDMLNRMDSLATQSANGTYDNGKKLLNGDLDGITRTTTFLGKADATANKSAVDLTVKTQEKVTIAKKETDFSFALATGTADASAAVAADGKVTVTLKQGVDYSAADIQKLIKDANLDKVTDAAEKDAVKAALANVAVSGKGITTAGTGTALADTTGTAKDPTGASLVLQIGDTADKYNKMSVNVGDMHSKALGIDTLTVADQDGAAAAIQSIKDAINTVSSTRGDLGAIQNRLEHTQNNLSVMTENIQDAESTIRDTDVADEMMAYTKNNILIQSAQAMLAQANQVPQGVLQLLQ